MNQKQAGNFSEFLTEMAKSHPLFKSMQPDEVANTTTRITQAFQGIYDPTQFDWTSWANGWAELQQSYTKLWLNTFMEAGKGPTKPSKDARFRGEEWNEGAYAFLRQSYELTSKAMVDMADKAGLPKKEQQKLSFYTRVTSDALAPSNFALTNPEVLAVIKETNGTSLMDGFKNLMADLEKGYLATTDEAAFEVGGNLATTPGSVIYRNELIELIQYDPMTSKVRKKPILVVPPCVNKFYIFDINEKKSMVRYLLEQGQTVFMISWRNAGPDTKDYGWDEYLEKGVYQALEVATEISKSDQADLLSWCNGGTLLLAAMAVMTLDQKAKVGSATFLSSMIDFADQGGVEVFIDQQQIDAYKTRLQATGVVPGRDIANAMAMLHVNESIWGFVVNNYLKGKSPAPFDVLYWNADTSNLPETWYSYYVEEMYHANKLKVPNALTLLGRPVDTRNIDAPCYFVAATGDHIVPWTSSHGACDLVSGPSEFVLTAGGHVSGTVINHPERNRRFFLSNGPDNVGAEDWQTGAARTEGSWWPHWLTWLDEVSGGSSVAAPKSVGNKQHNPLAPAPGTYVLEDVPQDGKLPMVKKAKPTDG